MITPTDLAGISEDNRRHLSQLHRRTQGLVDVEEAASFLGFDRIRAAKFLAQLAAQGWARRLRRGLYLLIPLEATSPEDWHADAWVVAERLFRPGYIAGWSACEHWGLTEQIFRDVAIFTAAPIRERRLTVTPNVFALRRLPAASLFGTRAVWRGATRVQVSDPTRTVADLLDAPKWGGGIRHVAQVVDAYFASPQRDEALLLDYIRRIGNAAAAKRLGYLLEARGVDSRELIDPLAALVTTGYARLDPTAPARGPRVARWNVQVNVDVTTRAGEQGA